ncbi:MAG: YegS/Rv2252/BmrU family lipid kinase [Alistipes sp.]|nr:YegS/Rv2252/BmrU family lipid kinase [Alistipes sp.]
MKALIVYNPKAGRGSSVKFVKEAVAIFRERGIVLERRHLILGVNPFDGALDTELVVVCGGDGSINYVVNCMRQAGINPTLGIIPMGTANDMANALDIPSNPRDAAMLILNGTERNIDCCKVNDRYFVNIFSFGTFTTASQRTSREAKQILGKLAYLKPGLDDVKDMHSVSVHIKSDKEEYEGNIYMFLAFNGITAGRIPLTRDSHVDDGLMDVIVFEKRNKILSYSDMIRYLLGGNPDAVRHFRCSELVVSASQDLITDMDGERGPDFPLHISCEPGALKIRL